MADDEAEEKSITRRVALSARKPHSTQMAFCNYNFNVFKSAYFKERSWLELS